MDKADAQRACRQMKNKWWSGKAEEIQVYAWRHQSFEMYKAIKEVYGPVHKGPPAVRALDLSLIHI